MHHTIIILGYLGRDAEMRFTPSGQAVTKFSVATNNQYTNAQGEKVKETIWWNVSVWGKLAEVCSELKKGARVYAEAQMSADKETGSPRIWKKQDGTAATSYELNARVIRFLSPRGDIQSIQQDDVPAENEIHF